MSLARHWPCPEPLLHNHNPINPLQHESGRSHLPTDSRSERCPPLCAGFPLSRGVQLLCMAPASANRHVRLECTPHRLDLPWLPAFLPSRILQHAATAQWRTHRTRWPNQRIPGSLNLPLLWKILAAWRPPLAQSVLSFASFIEIRHPFFGRTSIN